MVHRQASSRPFWGATTLTIGPSLFVFWGVLGVLCQPGGAMAWHQGSTQSSWKPRPGAPCADWGRMCAKTWLRLSRDPLRRWWADTCNNGECQSITRPELNISWSWWWLCQRHGHLGHPPTQAPINCQLDGGGLKAMISWIPATFTRPPAVIDTSRTSASGHEIEWTITMQTPWIKSSHNSLWWEPPRFF